MQLKTLLWLLAAGLLVGGWYFFANRPAVAPTTSVTATSTPSATTTPPKTAAKAAPSTRKVSPVAAKVAGIGTIPYLIGLNQNLVCTIKTQSGYSRTGTLYVAGGKVRGNFTGSSMIDDGTHLYAWMSGAIKGIVLLAGTSASGSAIATNGGIDLSTDISFACNPWTVDASVFTPPSSISFFSSL